MVKKKVQHHTRRQNGEGSVFQRKDGTWCGYVTVGYDNKGKQVKKYIYGTSRADVNAKTNRYKRKNKKHIIQWNQK